MGAPLSGRDAIKQWFDLHGVSISDWAKANGFKRDQVYAVLNGHTAGRRGTAHQIAVKLGLKDPGAAPKLPALGVRPAQGEQKALDAAPTSEDPPPSPPED